MVRMIDSIKQGRSSIDAIDNKQDILEWIEECQFVNIDNVITYYNEHYALMNKITPDLFTNIVPPFDKCWYECRISSADSQRVHAGNIEAFSVLVITVDLTELNTSERSAIVAQYKLTQDDGNHIRWISAYGVFIQQKNGFPVGPFIVMTHLIDKEGNFYGNLSIAPTKIIYPQGVDDEKYMGKLSYIAATMVYPIMFANSLMSCQNVVLETDIVDNKIMRAYKRRHGIERTVFKAVNIKPIQDAMKKERWRTGNHTIEQDLLTIRRGHFKTFDDKPLFGKHYGKFWWPQKVSARQTRTYKVST